MGRQPTTRIANRSAYTPAPYTGNGLEVVENLTSATNTAKVLADVAKWHERRHNSRNREIARRLREVSGTQARQANDNPRQQTRRAA